MNRPMNHILRLPALLAALTLTLIAPLAMSQTSAPTEDPYLWLEEVEGERALAWVRERNAESTKVLQADPGYAPLRQQTLEVLNSRARIPSIVRRGDFVYNFWTDAQNPRGLWRRTTLADYRQPDPKWDVLLDVDALGKREGVNWVWSGAQCRGPDYRRCLVSLSRGGADAHAVREFDLVDRKFVDGGFVLPEAKSRVGWLDADHLLVGTDFGPGSLTDSGYPRVIKRWKRGQPLSSAVTLYEARKTDVSAWFVIDDTPGFERVQLGRSPDFYNTELSLLGAGDKLQLLDRPSDSDFSFWRDRVVISLRSDWTTGGRTWPRGALLVGDAAEFLRGGRNFELLFTPTARSSLAGWTATRSTLVLNIMEDVASRLEEWKPVAGRWTQRAVKAPFPGTLGVSALHDSWLKDDPLAEQLLLTYTDFLTPDSLLLARTGSDERELLKTRPTFYDAAGMRVEQRFATSRDGTRVPYFVVWPKGATADGRNPTLLYGYGGFELSMQPFYSGSVGRGWLARGGVFVLANIRGGGEYGPAWHQAALKANRQKSYDDFIAIAEDLVASKVTTPRQLGMQGGSNGGLLMGAVMVQRPDLFGAVVSQVPLLDMKRYHKLLAGASWMGEYGDPDVPAEWAYISRYSPYQNVKPGVKMPRVLFTTSTRDDRVHPGHARKMAARMREQGHEVLYYENIEGGHGGAADNEQRATMQALEYTFLWQQLRRP